MSKTFTVPVFYWLSILLLANNLLFAQEATFTKGPSMLFADLCIIGIEHKSFPKEKNRIYDKASAAVYGKEIAVWIEEHEKNYQKIIKNPEKHLVFSVDATLKKLPAEKAVALKESVKLWYEALQYQERFALTENNVADVKVSKAGEPSPKPKVYFLLERKDLEQLIQKINN